MPKDPDYAPPSLEELLEDMGGEQALLRALLAAGYADHVFDDDDLGMKLTALQLAVLAVPLSQDDDVECTAGKAVSAIRSLAAGGADITVIFTPPGDFPGGREPKTLLQVHIRIAAPAVSLSKSLFT